MKLQLLKDHVLVSIDENTETESGILLPEIARDQHDYRTGTVVHVGTEVKDLHEGEDVMLDFGGQWIRLHGRLLALVREGNVMAVLEKEASSE